MNELIVCATDFSPRAEAALAWALALARRSGVSVDLVHVARAYREDSRTLVFEGALVDAANVQVAGTRLREPAERASREHGISVRTHVLRGEPHEAILAHARQEEARFVVLGTCGLASIERWMLGSVAERVVRAADRPVVLVPRMPDRNAWAPGAPRAPRVLAGLGQHDDVGLRRFLVELRRAGDCDVTFAHLYWPLVEYERLGLQGPRDPIATDPDVVKSLEPALRRRIEGLPGRGEVTLDVRPAWGDTTANLLLAAEDADADLLVVGVEPRPGLGDALTKSVAERLSLPVAVRCPSPASPPTRRRDGGRPAGAAHGARGDGLLGAGQRGHPTRLRALRVEGEGGRRRAFRLRPRAPAAEPGLRVRGLPSGACASSGNLRARVAGQEPARFVPPEAAGVTTHVSVIDGGHAAEAGIVQASERLDVDAICLASHGRGGAPARTMLGSVASEVIHRAHRPVLVVRKP